MLGILKSPVTLAVGGFFVLVGLSFISPLATLLGAGFLLLALGFLSFVGKRIFPLLGGKLLLISGWILLFIAFVLVA